MIRVVAYIDGFNLYFGLKDAKWKKYYWLNLQLLAQNLLRQGQELIYTKYFTSRISLPIEKQRRQSIFIEAVETLTDVEIFYGHYQTNPRKCMNCGYKSMIASEKMTDVNIAVEMMADAYQDRFDTALLISADSDLTAPIASIRQLFPEKKVVVAFPPMRNSIQLQRTANAYIPIGRATIAKSVFPDRIQKADGFVLHCPVEWH
jgi:uncharacterized LabA/DUF88 family protein